MSLVVSGKGEISHFVGVGIFLIEFNRTDLGCWRFDINTSLIDSAGSKVTSVKTNFDTHLSFL